MKNYDIDNPSTIIEPEVGEEFTINNIQITYQCKSDEDITTDECGCDLCGLMSWCVIYGKSIHCNGDERKDENDVYFIRKTPYKIY